MSVALTGSLILFGVLFTLMLLRVPIAFCLGIATLVTATYLDIPFFNLFQRMASGVTSFTFLSVPFFIIMAQIMTDGGITDRLLKFCNVMVGRVQGGTAIVNCVISKLFSGVSGSAIADISSSGGILIPAMIKEGYDEDFSVAVTCTSSIVSAVSPPSQNLIFYVIAAGSGLSIGTMFIAGYIPGVVFILAMCVCAYVISVKKKYPVSPKYSWKENAKIIRESLLGLTTVLIIAVGITTGIFTATESGAVAAVYALFITIFVYRTMTPKRLMKTLLKSLRTLGVVMAIIATSMAFGHVLSVLRIPTTVATYLTYVSDNPSIIMLLMVLMMIVLGMFMDMGILIILLTPILYPVAMSIGYDPYHFGLIVVMTCGLGLITPPVGAVLFAGCAIADIPIERSIKSFLPFYFTYLAVLFLIIVFPSISLILPRVLGHI